LPDDLDEIADVGHAPTGAGQETTQC
jgi:hypothetical protein